MSEYQKGPPALMFLGQLVKVSTTLPAQLPEGMETEDDAIPATALTGIMVDTDDTYLTLGTLDEEARPVPLMAVKHEDIMSIELFSPEEPTRQVNNGELN